MVGGRFYHGDRGVRRGGAEDTNDDVTVDVLDRLALLAAWGPCP
ncbi:MAG: hypothetical protein ACYTGG_05605 [Planctomycetota bacterium]